jgi:hypothetical protein
MLENVRHTGGIFWYGFERHAEGVFTIITADVNMTGAGLFVLEFVEEKIGFRDLLDPLDDISPASSI